ncbi:MAG: type III pantothenate kinase [Gemmataceae bacterium]
MIVIDVGNTRVKFGLCSETAVIESAAMRPTEEDWSQQLEIWRGGLDSPPLFAIAGVVPATLERVAEWVRGQRGTCTIIESFQKLKIQVALPQPEQVGIDRLLGALAARAMFPDTPLIVVDAGSAVTINAVSGLGMFDGGAILPGLQLMANALHRETALLPQTAIVQAASFPGQDTHSAIQCGVWAAACGSIERIVGTYKPQKLIFTGGDGGRLEESVSVDCEKHLQPRLVLEGIRIAAQVRS